jgi:hypothetical protein
MSSCSNSSSQGISSEAIGSLTSSQFSTSLSESSESMVKISASEDDA